MSDSYPAQPIRMLAPGPAGGPGDITGRLIAERLSPRLGQPVMVENQVNNVALEMAAKAPPDGYTIVMAGGSTYIGPNVYKNIRYDPVRDFAPISLVASVFNVLVVHPSLPVNTVGELIGYMKERPDQLRFASSGYGSAPHLAGELFCRMAGVRMMHTPYRGHVAADKAVLGGVEAQLMFDAMPPCMPHVKKGQLKALAVTTKTRVASAPGIPTLSECGLTGYEISPGMGVLAPAGTPAHIVAILSREIRQIMQLPDMKARLDNDGAQAIGSTPEEFAAYIPQALANWKRIVTGAGLEKIDTP